MGTFNSGPGGDLGATEITTTGKGTFGNVAVSESAAPAAPADGAGGILYCKSDGKIYWISNELAETDLTSGGGGGLTEEEVEDFVGGMVTGGTETGISVTYTDGAEGAGVLNFVVSDLTVAGDSGSIAMTPGDTLTIAGGTNCSTAMSGDTLTVNATASDTWHATIRGETTVSQSTGNYYHKSGMASMIYGTIISQTNFTTTFPAWKVHYYTAEGTIPLASDLTKWHLTGHKNGSDNDTTTLTLWKCAAPTNGEAELNVNTITSIFSVEIDVDGNELFNKSGTLSASNSFAAGELYFITFHATSGAVSADHYFQLALEFTPS